MIDHFGINVKDIEANKAFYEAVLVPLGYAKTIDEEPYGMGFSNPDRTQHTGMFWLGKGEPSSPLHFAFTAPSRAAVDACILRSRLGSGRAGSYRAKCAC